MGTGAQTTATGKVQGPNPLHILSRTWASLGCCGTKACCEMVCLVCLCSSRVKLQASQSVSPAGSLSRAPELSSLI